MYQNTTMINMKYNEIEGNLITLAYTGELDVISHGCNCFCNMKSGIAPQMVKAFGCDNFELEQPQWQGNINKLGQIDYEELFLFENKIVDLYSNYDKYKDSKSLYVINSYTQYRYGKKNHADGVEIPVDYDAIKLVMRKINHNFKGLHVGLPLIGCGLAGGDWDIVSNIIKKELCDCNVTIVHFKE